MVRASHQRGLGSIAAWCHIWVELVVGSRFAPRFDQDRGLPWKPVEADVVVSLNIVIYFIYNLFNLDKHMS